MTILKDYRSIYFDHDGNTLTVWFDDPQLEFFCEEVDDDIVLMKDLHDRVIGIETLFLRCSSRNPESKVVRSTGHSAIHSDS